MSTTVSSAQKKEGTEQQGVKEKKYALMVSQEEHIKVAVKTSEDLFTGAKYKAKDFEVIICGKAVESLKAQGELEAIVQEGIANGIKFKVCGISMEKAKVAESDLIKGITVVPNGLLRMFDLQEVGYYTIEL